MADPTPLLAKLTRVLAQTEPRDPLSLRLCSAFSAVLGAGGGAITLGYSSSGRTTLCSTDDFSGRVEDAQEVLREGPSLDAFRTGLPVTGLSMAEHRTRWPMLSDMLATEDGYLSLHAFPLRPDVEVMGVVSIYLDHARTIAVTVEEAQFLANAVAVALLGDLTADSITDQRWSARDKVDQATGMVVAQLRVRPADALAVLRAHAFAHSATLAEVADQVLTRRLDFKDTRSTDGGHQ